MKPVIKRFIRYVSIDTRSVQIVPGVEPVHPSSHGQTVLINMLLDELHDLKVPESWVKQLNDGSFLVQIPASQGFESAPHIALAAHVDTYFGCPGDVKPLIHDYSGGDLALPNNSEVIPAADLQGLEGKRIITSDGTSLLGSDDKAGVAAIMTFIENMMKHDLRHGPLTVWICTDEEVGEVGVAFLPDDTAEQWDCFWTVDGEELEAVDVGCFFGAGVDVEFMGNDSHPGTKGDSLRPAHYAACDFVARLGREAPVPWQTSEKESFIYVPELAAMSASKSLVKIIPRTFDQEEIPKVWKRIKNIADSSAMFYGVKVRVDAAKLHYVSTEVAIKSKLHLLRPALEALKELGITPKLKHVRAGTDGAMLNMTHPNIPAPNMGTGGRNLHGVREFVVVDELELIPEVLAAMVRSYAGMSV